MYAFPFLLLQFLALVHVHVADHDDISEACKIESAKLPQGKDIVISFERPHLNCKNNTNDIAIWAHWKGKTKQTRVKVRKCAGVSKVWMSAENGGQFVETTSGGEIASCRRTNDTVLINKPGRVKTEQTIKIQSTDNFKLVVIYQGTSVNGKNITTVKHYTFAAKPNEKHFRHRRNAAEVSTISYTDKKTTPVSEFSLKDCEKNRSCIRFGKTGCDHMECDYFLSYLVLNKENIILELSAKTDGWVAVGFSSDAKLGGGDDVIACKRKHTSTNEVIAQPLWISVTHFTPELKESKLNLTSAQYAGGYIYCRVTRPLNVKMDKNLDLTNDWYQLYVTGPIEASGRMLKPENTPKTSPDKMTVLMHENRISVGSGANSFTVCMLSLLLGVISPHVS